ncbi:hypothetical protein [Floccifex sp.]|uniref:hypothetical protein n=1 Tax=Floccifex sp. TaxID=2815810 RepID=UPI002A74B88B|nr:hypothetical protein [Floccifex sp.]MDD7280955.1 hypothetical protein [Erysipelotrichaceae bacterium]MDY2957830.1 hypothetical protein [Floccifex sp.]
MHKKNSKQLLLLIIIMCLASLVVYHYIQKNKVPEDFWNLTAKAINYKDYIQGEWNINIEDGVKNHPNLAIRNINDNETISYFFSDEGISYYYDVTTTEKNGTINNEQLFVESTDSEYKNYSMKYTNVIYHDQHYFDTITSSGELKIQSNESISYDNVPLLEELIKQENTLIQNFEKKFKIDYSETDFVNLPELCKDIKFENITDSNEVLDEISYFSKPDINAKGHQIQTFLKWKKNSNEAVFGTYDAEQKAYISQVDINLIPRNITSCYDFTTQYDYDVDYTIYVSGNIIYLYPLDITDEMLAQEIRNNCPNSIKTLDLDIKPIEMW